MNQKKKRQQNGQYISNHISYYVIDNSYMQQKDKDRQAEKEKQNYMLLTTITDSITEIFLHTASPSLQATRPRLQNPTRRASSVAIIILLF